jgi:hypothetical protein
LASTSSSSGSSAAARRAAPTAVLPLWRKDHARRREELPAARSECTRGRCILRSMLARPQMGILTSRQRGRVAASQRLVTVCCELAPEAVGGTWGGGAWGACGAGRFPREEKHLFTVQNFKCAHERKRARASASATRQQHASTCRASSADENENKTWSRLVIVWSADSSAQGRC